MSAIDGDFDDDSDWDCDDVNALTAEIAGGTNDLSFDLNGDGSVDTGDLDDWLAEAGAINNASGGAYLPGDTNLSGFVDVNDFRIWSNNKFSNNTSWCSSDLNADGSVGVADFNIWNNYKFQSSDGTRPVPVPEPNCVLILLAVFVVFMRACKVDFQFKV